MDGSLTIAGALDAPTSPAVPADQLLKTAIHGWAIRNGVEETGCPAQPQRKVFLPVFIRLLHEARWLEQMKVYAAVGLHDDGADPSLIDTTGRLMQHPAIHGRFVDELAELAAR